MRYSAIVPLAATFVAAVALSTAQGGAQTLVEPDRLGWTVDVPDARRTTEPRHFRAYSETAVVELQLGVTNESDASVLVDQDSLRAAVRVALSEDTGVVPVGALWSSSVFLSDRTGSVTVPPEEAVWLRPRVGAAWTLELRRRDGASFQAGDYRLSVAVQGLASALSYLDGRPWVGGPILPETDLTLTVLPPVNPRERSDAALLPAQRAISRGDFGAAVRDLERAVALDPSYTLAGAQLAMAYSAIGRYQESALLFEQLVAAGQLALDRRIAVALARAYVGLNDEVRATGALRRAGVPPGEVAAQITALQRAR